MKNFQKYRPVDAVSHTTLYNMSKFCKIRGLWKWQEGDLCSTGWPQYLVTRCNKLTLTLVCRVFIRFLFLKFRLNVTMGDTNNYAIEQWIVVGVCVHERPQKGKTMEEVHVDFQERFCQESLWGFIKEIVAQQPYKTTDDLKQAVGLPFNRIAPQMVRKLSYRTCGAKRWSVMTMTDHKHIHWTLKACTS